MYVLPYNGTRCPDRRTARARRLRHHRTRAAGDAAIREATIDPVAIGGRVKALREAMGLSLRDLAERSGVGAATLSQVERGESSPTLAVAARIADGLELTLSQLLRIEESRHVVIVRRGSGRISSRPGHEIEELTPPLPGQRADVSRHRLAPGGSTGGAGRPSDPRARQPRDGRRAGGGGRADRRRGAPPPRQRRQRYLRRRSSPHLSNSGESAAELLAVIAAGLRRS